MKTECDDKIDGGEHRWCAYSTATGTGQIMLRCLLCGVYGTVDDPTRSEWIRAFHAPSKPYIWRSNKRVVIQE
jgi:hypothetical protein